MCGMGNKIKPCPFCAGEASHITRFNESAISCSKCFARTAFLADEKDAAARWNERACLTITDELQACPCCGGSPMACNPKDTPLWQYIECARCMLRQLARSTREEAMALWNRRV